MNTTHPIDAPAFAPLLAAVEPVVLRAAAESQATGRTVALVTTTDIAIFRNTEEALRPALAEPASPELAAACAEFIRTALDQLTPEQSRQVSAALEAGTSALAVVVEWDLGAAGVAMLHGGGSAADATVLVRAAADNWPPLN